MICNTRVASLLLTLLGLLVTASASRAAEFAATMVQSGPQGETTTRIFVKDGRTRTEMVQSGQPLVVIADTERGATWLLYPDERKYMERVGHGGQPMARDSRDNPCEGMPGARCDRLGTEPVNGRPAVKWRIVIGQQGREATGYQWIDSEHGFPLRQELPDGQTVEMNRLGPADHEQRLVERWEMVRSAGPQGEQRAIMLFDPRLKLAVREEFPGGFVRELRDIREETQADALFQVPEGFQLIQGGPAGPQR